MQFINFIDASINIMRILYSEKYLSLRIEGVSQEFCADAANSPGLRARAVWRTRDASLGVNLEFMVVFET